MRAHLRETASNGETPHVAIAMNAQLACRDIGHHRHVPRQNPEVAVASWELNHIDRLIECGALGRHDCEFDFVIFHDSCDANIRRLACLNLAPKPMASQPEEL